MSSTYVAPDCLRAAAKTRTVQLVKRRAYELMHVKPGDRVLDVGCDPGIDTMPLGKMVGPSGQVVGVDHDPQMIAEANAEAAAAAVSGWTAHLRWEASSLPFASDYFDAAHSERLFLHLMPPKPELTMAEMMRVTKPGGWIVVADLDWGTLSIDTPEPDIERRLLRLVGACFLNPYAGRQLRRLLRQVGLGHISVDLFGFPLDYASMAYLLPPIEQLALAAGIIGYDEWYRWRAGLAQAELLGTFYAHVMIVLAAGQKH